MEGWKREKVKHLGTVYSGSTPSTDRPEYWNGSIVWITPNDLSKNKGKYFQNSERKISKDGLKYSSAILLPARTLVVSSRAPIGYLTIPQTEFTTNQGCKSIVFNKNNDIEFQYYNFQYNIERLKQIGEGTTFSEVSKKFLENFELDMPTCKKEQIGIARIFATIDNAMSETKMVIGKYQCIRKGLMQDLLTKGIDKRGLKREEPTHSFVLKRGTKIPEDWEVKTLEEVTIKITDGSHYSPIPQDEGFLIGNVKDMMPQGFNFNSCARISIKDFVTLKDQNCSPKTGDVLLSKDGTIGRVIHFDQDEEMVVLSSIAIIRVKATYDSKYVSYLLKSFLFEKQLYALESGSALKRIILKDIKQLCFPFPKLKDEQLGISMRIESVERQIFENNSKLSKLQLIKSGLMQDLLTGKIRIPDMLINQLVD